MYLLTTDNLHIKTKKSINSEWQYFKRNINKYSNKIPYQNTSGVTKCKKVHINEIQTERLPSYCVCLSGETSEQVTSSTRNNWFVISFSGCSSPRGLWVDCDDPEKRGKWDLQTFFAILEFYFPPKQRFIHIYTSRSTGRWSGGGEEKQRNCRGKLYVNAIK